VPCSFCHPNKKPPKINNKEQPDCHNVVYCFIGMRNFQVISLLYSCRRGREEVTEKDLSLTWRLLGFHVMPLFFVVDSGV